MKPVFAILTAVVPLALPLSGPSAHATQAETNAVSCSRLNVNGTKPGELMVSVNGIVVGTFYGDAGVYQDLEPRMRPGLNRVRLSFASPGEPGTSAELRCLPPGVRASRDTILRFATDCQAAFGGDRRKLRTALRRPFSAARVRFRPIADFISLLRRPLVRK